MFLSSKVIKPVVKPIMARVLERFAESEKGVLTQISIGSGAVAKMVQEGLKFLNL